MRCSLCLQYESIPFLSSLDLLSFSADLCPGSLTGQAHLCLRNNAFALLSARKTISLNSLLRSPLKHPLQRNCYLCVFFLNFSSELLLIFTIILYPYTLFFFPYLTFFFSFCVMQATCIRICPSFTVHVTQHK